MTVEDTSVESAQEQLEPAYPLRGTGSYDIDPSDPALPPDAWDAVRGVLLNGDG